MLRAVSSPPVAASGGIDGSSAHVRKETSGCLFGDCAKLAWDKPDTVIADLAGVSDRAARDYLNGKVAVPAIVAAALLAEIVKRE